MSISWTSDVEPAPGMLVLPPAADSLDEANDAIELWEHYSGKTLDPAQRLTVEVMMATRSDGRWAAATTGREMARQNGKGDEIEVVELWGLVQRGEAILHTVHDAVMLASQAQQRMLSVLDRPDLKRKKRRQWMGTGQQMIEMRNGGVIFYRTRTGGGGRGVDDVSRLVIDEAQHATQEHLSAVSSTLLANSNPQMNALGTSGLLGRSDWWWTIRKRALRADPGAFGYVGHTAENVYLDDDGRVVQDPVDVKDRDQWLKANPVLIRDPSKWEFLEEELERLGDAAFAREHLGVWDPLPESGASVVDLAVWNDLEDVEKTRPAPVSLAVVVSPDQAWASIGLAGMRTDGHRHVQIVQSGKGTGWIVDRLVELKTQWNPLSIALDPSGPEGSLVGDLTAAGVDLNLFSAREVAQACGAFLNAVMDGTLHHSSQQLLNISIRAAGKQQRGEAWIWRSIEQKTDVSPLKAVSLALAALTVTAAVKPDEFVPRRIR